jgi:hypothetical protein
MSATLLGVACALPVTLLIGARYYVFRRRMDSQAKRSYARMTALFLLFAVTAAVLLFTHQGEFPLPAAWELALAGVTASFLLGFTTRR